MGLPNEPGFKWKRGYAPGPRNTITDVPGVLVGQVTLAEGEVNTGVTVVIPQPGNLFRNKVLAGCDIINGFGKSIGLLQLQELGQIESPIVLTNTMSVGTAYTALTRYMLEQDPDIGVKSPTVNSLVLECNDGRINDIRGMHVKEEHVIEAIANAAVEFEEGAAGAGRGMVCLGFKGGIGSASRVIEIGGEGYLLGALVMTNFGARGNLTLQGLRVDPRSGEAPGRASAPAQSDGKKSEYSPGLRSADEQDQGSVIIVLATNIPLSERQLARVSRRAVVGLARTGSYLGHGSGDIAVTFTTANRIPENAPEDGSETVTYTRIHDSVLDRIFACTAEVTEEAVVSSLWHAETVEGRKYPYVGLREYLEKQRGTGGF